MAFCTNCGAEVYPEDTFCTECGEELDAESGGKAVVEDPQGADAEAGSVSEESEAGSVSEESEAGSVSEESEAGSVSEESEVGAVSEESEAGPEYDDPQPERAASDSPATSGSTASATPGSTGGDSVVGTADAEPGYAELAGTSKTPRVRDQLSRGWAFLRDNPAAFALFGVGAVLQLLGLLAGGGVLFVGWVLSVAVLAVGTGVVVAGIARVQAGEEFDIDELSRRSLDRLGGAIVAGVIWSILVGIGFMLLILPGLYLLGRFGFVAQSLFLESAGPIEAFKSSWSRSQGHLLTNLGVILVSYIPVVVLGTIPLVGQIVLTVFLPLMFAALTSLYLELEATDDDVAAA